MTAPLLPNEESRLDALRHLDILDTPPEARFDRITRLTALALNCPVSLVTFIDSDRQWFKSSYGTDLHETPRDIAFCAHTILESELLVVEDARRDARFANNPLVTGTPNIRFYAGAPLRNADGLPLGSLCVIDFEPRVLQSRERTLLSELCALAREQLIAGHLSERDADRRTLRASEQRYPDAFDNAPIGLALLALDGRYLRVNRALCSIVGYSSDELLGMKMQDISHPDDLAADFEQVRRVRARQISTFHVEKRYFHKRGHLVWVSIVATIARDPDGKALHYISMFQDISERREAEQVKSNFLATAAHELRSPLSSVYGFAELLLQKEFKPAKQRELLGIIHNQAQNMTRLINQLLDLARMEAKAGRDFQMARHSPQSVIEPIVRGFLSSGREPATLQLAVDLPDICVDAEKTGQALTNILSNAFKYSPQTSIVDVRVERAGTHEVAIRVRDHGVGIAAVALPHVFERFYRVGNTSVTGTGLGMTLVKEIAERQGGRVSIDSEVGKWTEVTLFLPIADCRLPIARRSRHERRGPEKSADRGRP